MWPLQEAGSHLGRVGRALQGRRHRRHRQDRYDRQRACHCLGTIYVNLSFGHKISELFFNPLNNVVAICLRTLMLSCFR